LPAGAIVALPELFDAGALEVLLVLFCVVLLGEVDEPDVDCACKAGADIVRQSAAAAKRESNLLRMFIEKAS